MGNMEYQIDLKKAVREQKQIISRCERNAEREILKLERKETKTMTEIMNLAHVG